MTTERRTYGPSHPVTVALVALAMAYLTKASIMKALIEQATRRGIDTNSDLFDQAAEVAGLPYCRALDLYVDRETKATAEALHFTQAHHALA